MTFSPQLLFVEEVTSTNDRVRQDALAGAPDGYAVHADMQRAGRGRLGRTWTSEGVGNVHLTILLRRPMTQQQTMTLPLRVGVAAAEAIESFAPVQVELKWPNDLWMKGAKLGGILCERVDPAPGGAAVLVGIGINIASRPSAEAIRDGGTPPTCLADHLDDVPDARDLAAALRRQILVRLDAAGWDWLAAWRSRDAGAGRWVELVERGVVGRAAGIDADGALRVELGDGRQERAIAGEIRFLDAPPPR